jgi:hypothetical protein
LDIDTAKDLNDRERHVSHMRIARQLIDGNVKRGGWNVPAASFRVNISF